MPAGTQVDKIFQALKGKMPVGKAAATAQKMTGTSLRTGKPPKGKKKPAPKKKAKKDTPMHESRESRMMKRKEMMKGMD